MITYGYYSQQQLTHLQNSEGKEFPYIYYKNQNDEIVQITEATSNPNYQSLFNDAVNVGELKKFYCVSATPLDLESINKR